MKYSDQLKTDEWKLKRLEILERDNHKCTQCNKTTYLHIHHNYYEDGKYAWEYPNTALKTLCRGCHRKFHKTHTLQNVNKPTSFKVYEKYMEVLFLLDKSQFGVFMYCCKKANPDTNKVSIVLNDKDKLVKQLEVTIATVNKAINKLIKLNFLIGAKGNYMVNPMLIWKGEDILRQKLLQSTKFEISAPDFMGKNETTI